MTEGVFKHPLARPCQRCPHCPFDYHAPNGYLDVGGVGYTALACAVISNSYRDLLLSNREERIAALTWLYSADGEDLLTQVGIAVEPALKQAVQMFKCGEIRGGVYQSGG